MRGDLPSNPPGHLVEAEVSDALALLGIAPDKVPELDESLVREQLAKGRPAWMEISAMGKKSSKRAALARS